MFRMLITWGVMTSHIISIGIKLIESQQTQNWSLEQFMKVEGKRGFTYRYIIIDIFYDWEHSLKYDMLKG